MNKNGLDLYITILKYGKEKEKYGTTNSDFFDYLMRNGYITGENRDFIDGVFIEVFTNSNNEKDEKIIQGKKYYMNITSRIRLLEYEQLEQARSFAWKSMQVAISAIGITLLATILQIFMVQKVSITNTQDITLQESGTEIIE